MKVILIIGFSMTLLSDGLRGQGTILWNDSVNGPLSQDFNNPTRLSQMQQGTNSVIGQTEVVPTPPNWAGYPDFFTLTIPTNLFVSAIYLQIDKPNVWTWLGDTSYANPIGYSLNPSSGSLLSQLGVAAVGPGVYGMYIDNHDQEAFTSIANYRLDFFVQTIPEPGTVSLFLVGAVAVGFHRWKRSPEGRALTSGVRNIE